MDTERLNTLSKVAQQQRWNLSFPSLPRFSDLSNVIQLL